MKSAVLALFMFAFSWAAYGGLFDNKNTLFGQSKDPVTVEEAFVFAPRIEPNGQLVLQWTIRPDYYLYRDRLKFTLPENVVIAERVNAPAKDKDDPLFGQVAVYYEQAEVTLYLESLDGQPAAGPFEVSYQGCWEGGICYPPVTATVDVADLPKEGSRQQTALAETPVSAPVTMPQPPVALSEQDQFAQLLTQKNLLLTLGAFFVAGLALSLTPCVFPMIPIISSIIAGHGHRLTTGRAFFLSAVYVLAVSVTYTIAGVLAGLFGENLQAAFQNVWVIGTFSLVFVLLALSMFGFYDLQLPSRWQSSLSSASHHQKGGTVTGVAVMGLLSALIVGPCMAAPLAGALIYIGQTGDPLLGGAALFSLSLGMGVPILLIGASAGKLLPKAGIWMDAIKAGFGVMLLLMAIWMLSRVVSTPVTMTLTAIVLIVTAIYMRAVDALSHDAGGWHRLWKGVGILLLIYGGSLLIGVMAGSRSMLYPLQGLASSSMANSAAAPLSMVKVTSPDELDRLLADAKANRQPVMLDFYADWCISCIELEQITFVDSRVQQALSGFMRIKVDVTANDDAAKALNKAYGVIGPPALIFYDQAAQLRPELTVVGMINPDPFLAHLARLSGPT